MLHVVLRSVRSLFAIAHGCINSVLWPVRTKNDIYKDNRSDNYVCIRTNDQQSLVLASAALNVHAP